jgi:site-specific recombinase XerD
MEEIRLHQFGEKLELAGYSRRAVEDYPYAVGRFLRYLEEVENVKSLEDVRPEHITAYHTYLQFGRFTHGKHLAPRTVGVLLGPLKTFYRIMYQEKLVPHDYSANIIQPKRRSHLPRHVPNQEQMTALLAAVDGESPLAIRDRCMLELFYATGLRSLELRSLKLDDYDSDEKTLFITGKGEKDRIVPVGSWMLRYMADYLQFARPKLLKKPTDIFFITKRGTALTKGHVGYLVESYARKANLGNITPHTLRHACATHLLQNGADIRWVQELLGHAYLSSTQIYTRVDISYLKQAHRYYHPRERRNEDGS